MARLIGILFFLFVGNVASAQLIAFPGAEGFGKYAVGGRGGSVYHVTNLNDSGPGSFRDAVSQPHRMIVFDVGGVIRIRSKIKASSFLTIAGQTAPGEGITVYGDGISFSGTEQVIVRYVRFRGSMDMGRGSCAVSADYVHDLIFDHISVEWGRWDNLHVKKSNNVTFQYCLIGEAIDPQRFGALLESPVNLTIHHCLWLNNQSRNPKAKAGVEFINNLIYNWGKSGFVGGHSAADHYQDILNNYFIAGPNSSESFLSMFTATDHVYQQGNLFDGDRDGKLNGRLITEEDFFREGATLLKRRTHQGFPESAIEDPAVAYRKVLREAGASLKRDATDRRLAGYAKSLGKKGMIIHTEAEAGGQKSGSEVKRPPSYDTDADGMPDRWEKRKKLNRNNPSDAGEAGEDGYTRLEVFLNELTL